MFLGSAVAQKGRGVTAFFMEWKRISNTSGSLVRWRIPAMEGSRIHTRFISGHPKERVDWSGGVLHASDPCYFDAGFGDYRLHRQ